MNLQTQSKYTRRYFPLKEYLNLQKQQENISYTKNNLKELETRQISKRIEELQKQEEKGFVYLGEKNWLQSYLESENLEKFKLYSQWVLYNFENYLELNFKPIEDASNSDIFVWETILDAEDLNLNFKELSMVNSTPFDELELAIIGNKEKISKNHLIKLFEILHNLEYILCDLYEKIPKYSEESIMGIDIINNSDSTNWQLNLISEYGSEFNIDYQNYKTTPFNIMD
jgi:hypothetical protein